MALKDKLKTALDETRLLILGSQILFGFQLHGMFQDNFHSIRDRARILDLVAFFLMALTIACLIAPSMQHQIVERGIDSLRLHRATTYYAAFALVPFSISLGIDFFVVLDRHLGAPLAAAIGIIFFALAIFFWFGIEILWERKVGVMQRRTGGKTPLHARIEQMLTEARVLLPGAQALLGFQFTVLLSQTFDQLPSGAKVMHIAALFLIALTVILLIAPAAVHRITYGGEEAESFYRIGSGFIVAASLPLGLGIVADIYVAVMRAADSPALAVFGAIAVAVVLAALWYVRPWTLRRQRGA